VVVFRGPAPYLPSLLSFSNPKRDAEGSLLHPGHLLSFPNFNPEETQKAGWRRNEKKILLHPKNIPSANIYPSSRTR
jgi:hypothetical protein